MGFNSGFKGLNTYQGMGSVEGWKYSLMPSKRLGQVQVNFQLHAKMKCHQSCTSISLSQSLQVGGGGRLSELHKLRIDL